LPQEFGLREIESGEWKFRLTVTFENKNGSKTIKVAYCSSVFINAVTCCLDKNMPSINANAYKDEKQKLKIELSNLLESANKNIRCGLNGEANKIIEYLKAQCKCCNCS
jgi:hypothetical protein